MMLKVKDIPVTREAANARSPKRRPRYRSLMKTSGKAVIQKAVIAQASLGLSNLEIEELLHLAPHAIKKWRNLDKGFMAAHDEAIECYKASAKGELAGELPASVVVVKETISGVNEKPLRFEAAKANIRGLGVWAERQEQRVDGRQEITIRVEYDKDRSNSPPEKPALPAG